MKARNPVVPSDAGYNDGARPLRIGRNASRNRLALILLVGLGIALSWGEWRSPPAWTPDGLFYEAHVLQIRGASKNEALETAWFGQAAAALRAGPGRYDRASVRYSSRYYERRWTVPLVAAAVYSVFHRRSLKVVSLAGYLALGLLIYALLAQRFGWTTSLTVAAIVMAADPVRRWSFHPLTDSWGVALETAGLLAAVLVIDRGRRWVWLWLPVIVALALTRDSMITLAAATLALIVTSRTRTHLTLAASASLATGLPLIVFGGSVKENLAYAFNGFREPTDVSWSFVTSRYPGALSDLLREDWLVATQTWGHIGAVVLAVVVAAGIVMLFMRSTQRDPFFILLSGAFVGAVLVVLTVNNPTGLRIELVLVPSLAVAMAIALEQGLAAIRA